MTPPAITPAAALRRAAIDLEAAATVVEDAMGERANGIRQTLAMVRAALPLAEAHADVVVAAKLLADFCERSVDTGPTTKRPGHEAAHWRNLRAALAAATPQTPPERTGDMTGTLGMTFTRKTHGPAVGYIDGNRRKTAVGFDHDQFWQVSDLAQKNGVSFAEQVRRLIATALRKET